MAEYVLYHATRLSRESFFATRIPRHPKRGTDTRIAVRRAITLRSQTPRNLVKRERKRERASEGRDSRCYIERSSRLLPHLSAPPFSSIRIERRVKLTDAREVRQPRNRKYCSDGTESCFQSGTLKRRTSAASRSSMDQREKSAGRRNGDVDGRTRRRHHLGTGTRSLKIGGAKRSHDFGRNGNAMIAG